MLIALAILLGTVYGLIIAVIPSIGITTGLVALYPFVGYLISLGDPYLGIVFLMSVVAAGNTGDCYSSVLLGIPGSTASAATVVDGFPLARHGLATFALSAAIFASTLNGILWGILVFAFLPFYSKLVLVFGIPELWAFALLAFSAVTFVSSRSWIKSLIALALGLFLGSIGIDPNTAADRNTFGWNYLADGIQLIPLMAGLFAIPEIVDGLKSRIATQSTASNNHRQTVLGMLAVIKNWKLSIRGGVIGAIVGVLPGMGGSVVDWLAYGQTVATTPNPKIQFGKGNIRGVIGPESANNVQKATSMLPTVLFGIPGAGFAAVLIALFMYMGFEMGSPSLIYDQRFFNSLFVGFLASTVLVGMFCLIFTKYIAKIAQVPYIYYFPMLIVIVTWASVQYTGGWQDYVILILCSVLGFVCKTYKFSRPALLIGFILSERMENLTLQLTSIYNLDMLVNRPIFMTIVCMTLCILVWGILFNKNKIDYA